MLPTAIYTPSSKAIYTLPLLLCCWLEKILTLDVFGSVGCSSAVARLQDRLFPAHSWKKRAVHGPQPLPRLRQQGWHRGCQADGGEKGIKRLIIAVLMKAISSCSWSGRLVASRVRSKFFSPLSHIVQSIRSSVRLFYCFQERRTQAPCGRSHAWLAASLIQPAREILYSS